MTSETVDDEGIKQVHQLGQIIRSNHKVRKMVQATVKEFITVHENLLGSIKVEQLDQIGKLKMLNTNTGLESLNEKVTSEKLQLALCGGNSSGKTSFLHMFLQIPDILPVDDGPVTGRIVKLTYAEPKYASIRLYRTLKDMFAGADTKVLDSVDLSPFFTHGDAVQLELSDSRDDAHWDEIANIVEKYTARPAACDVNSDEFAAWARHFVEIHLPSPILKLNIDVYDTPGFLFHEAPVLREILADLVSLVRPTIVFLYNNSSVNNETIDGYLAVKDALKEIDSLSIFYLNTKVDVEHLPNVTVNTTVEQFEAILSMERAKRYQLLKEAPCLGNDDLHGLPKLVDECIYFDVCSVTSNDDSLGLYMNNNAIRRLIQFIANSDLIIAKRISKITLPAIEAFFDLAMMASHRTIGKLQELRTDANTWYDTFFSQHRKHFDSFLTEVYGVIEDKINRHRQELICQAAELKDRERMKSYMQTFMQHEAVQGALPDIIMKLIDAVSKFLSSNINLMVNALSNELLVGALHAEHSEIFNKRIDHSKELGIFKDFVLNYTISSTMLVVRFLFQDDKDEEVDLVNCLIRILLESRQRKRENQRTSTVPNDYKSEARDCLVELEKRIEDQKTMLHEMVKIWSDHHRQKFDEKIAELYSDAERLIPFRNKVHSLVINHIKKYARIYCQLYACQDFANFDGIEPILIDEETQKTTYSVGRATWGAETLFIKRLTDPKMKNTDAAYFEARYHLKVKQLAIPYIVDMKYLYEKRSNDNSTDLWMFFPIFERNLKNMMENPRETITFDQVRKMMIRIAIALECLHTNEIVHQNITPTNIVFDEKNEAHLVDWGDWISDYMIDATHFHHPESNEHGVNEDIRALGKLGRNLLQVLKDVDQKILTRFEELLNRCELATFSKPLTANEVKITLENI